MLYFDHAASTPPHEDVIRTISEVMKLQYANPSSLHRSGAEAGKLVQRARELAAELFGVSPKEWIFTSGGTESNNLAVLGAARRYRTRGSHVITTEVEHASVYEAFQQLEQEGFEVTYLPVDHNGRIRIADLEQALTDRTILVSIMQVNNETGAVQPVKEAGRLLAGRPRTLFHVDGVQAVGKLKVDLKSCYIDLFSMSAHKINGPKGTGWLYVRDGVELQPLMFGGGQESGIRSGTENVPAVVAAAKALRLAMESQEEREMRMMALRHVLAEGIEKIPELLLSGPSSDGEGIMAPHIVHFCYPGMKPEVLVHALEKHGIAASTKSACSSKSDKPSRVLQAMGRNAACAGGGVRLSFGDEHRLEHIELVLERLKAVVTKLKPLERRER
ncbi:cysteine desulfurase family protein [Paenibacillus tarimensis]|uniref:cysteine desulfurase family protein n=1 Tax=Paenibacillus tarimensis TaxID=416012 RepID=UPI001F3C3FDB|nr:cysteine desulfurase family protein [Paenibacillus tarimensis]MCF2942085.1 cysteine desulfurase [Paenibacillus tarimensis]